MKRVILLLPLLLSLLSAPARAEEEFRVAASVRPVHSILAALMEGVEGLSLLAPEKDPRLDRGPVDEAQQRLLREADLVVWVGPELESALAPLLAQPPAGQRVFTLLDSDAIKVLPMREDETKRDPYFWMDSRNAILLARKLAQLLVEMDPGRAHLYKRNEEKLMRILGRLDRELEYGYRGLKGGVGVLYYDTLQYFEQAYALQIGTILASPADPAIDTEALLRARLRIEEGDYACVLTETGLPAEQLDFLVGNSGIRTGELDTMGVRFEAGPGLYEALIRYDTTLIKSCLRKDGGEEEGAETASEAPDDDLLPGAAPGGGRFLLTDQDGRLFTEEMLRGKFQLIYFGYTFCPDICPTSLYTLSRALDLIGDKAKLVQPYFITIDPERDDPEVMKRYVGYFGHNLIGLTGTRAMIDRVARQYHVRYEKVVEEGGDPDLYLMDHTASVYVIAPDGTFITKFAHGITPEQMAEGLLEILP